MLDRSQFSQLLTQLYMQTDFKIPPFSFQIGDYVFLGSMNQGRNLRRKKFVTDFDGVFESENTTPLYKLFFKNLAKENTSIDLTVIDSYIQSIFQGKSVKEVFAQMGYYLKSKNLRRDQYYKACELAAKAWQPNSEAYQTVNEIRKMGYEVTVISGSPQETLEMAGKKIGFEDYEVIGTRFEFDDFGELLGIHPMLGDEKLKQKRRIIGDEPHIATTDDINTDYFITYGAELSIIVADKDSTVSQNERQVYLFDKGIRRNFGSLINHIKKFEYAFVRANKVSERSERAIIGIVQKMKSAESRTEFYHALKSLRGELEEFDLFSSGEKQFLFIDYGITTNAEKEKKLREEIFSVLEQLPEFVNTEAFASVLGMKNELG